MSSEIVAALYKRSANAKPKVFATVWHLAIVGKTQMGLQKYQSRKYFGVEFFGQQNTVLFARQRAELPTPLCLYPKPNTSDEYSG